MDQICRLLLSEVNTNQFLEDGCTDEQSLALLGAFDAAAKEVGLTPTNGTPELYEAQLRALDWAKVDKIADEVRCFWVNEDGTLCDLNVYRNSEASANPSMTESQAPSASSNPFMAKPVNIPGAVYLGIALIVLFYFAAYQGFSIEKVQAFLVRFVDNLKKNGKRTSS